MRLAIFTTSRAEFGILLPLIKELNQSKKFKVLLFVGGGHLHKYSDSLNEIIKSKINIKRKFKYKVKSDKETDIVIAISSAIKKINNIFKNEIFDAVLVLGDRYELISILSNCLIHKKPLIHLSGGEITTGSIDNQVRNMVSKVASYHFVSSELYKKNLIRMNEKKRNIFNTGALNVDNMFNIRNDKKINKYYIYNKFNLNNKKKLAIFTLHPETLSGKNNSHKSFKNILKILNLENYQIILTGTNLDPGYMKIVNETEKNKKNKNIHFYKSLGSYNYLSILKISDLIIGNSSSGIVEAPYFRIPCINIDNRQKGRYLHKNIIESKSDYKSLKLSFKKLKNKKFIKNLKNYKYIFGKKGAARRILKVLTKLKFNNDALVKI